MARNMIVRLGVDASDFQKKMAQAGASAESTGKRIKKSMTMSDIGAEVSKIMGWSGSGTSIGSINAGNIDTARSQLSTLQSYRDQLSGAGFDDYQFGLVSERIKELEYDLNEYTQSLSQAASAERSAAEEAEDLGSEITRSESFISRATRALRNMGTSGSNLGSVSKSIRRIGNNADNTDFKISKMIRTIRNTSVASFAFRIASSLFGRFSTVVRNYVSQNSELQAQVNSLSNSVSNALAPAINVVTSAFSYLMPYIVGVSNAIGELMTALTGSGWSTATSGAGKTAAATSGAAAAQKELNKQLMSFDQINRVESDSSSSGSSGGSGLGAEMEEVLGKTPAWLERLKTAFTDLFNSSEFDSANLGGKIGQILQTALDWLGSEGMNFDWSGVGTKLRENFDSFMSTGWLESLSHTLGIYLGGFADLVISLLGPQWEELQTAYENEGIQGAIVYVGGIIAGFTLDLISGLFTSLLSPMFTGVADYFREHGNDSIAGFFDGCAQAMTNVGNWIKENITDPIVNYVKNLLGIHSPSTVFASIGESCMSGLANGFLNGIAWIQEKIDDLKERVTSAASDLKEAFSFEWSLPTLRLPHLSVEWDPVDSVLANFFGVTAFPRLSVQWFAKGGILDGAQIFGSMGSTLLGGGENGREAILPLDSNTGWMDVLARRIAQSLETDSGSSGDTVVNVLLDGDLITNYVIKGIRRKSRAGTANI